MHASSSQHAHASSSQHMHASSSDHMHASSSQHAHASSSQHAHASSSEHMHASSSHYSVCHDHLLILTSVPFLYRPLHLCCPLSLLSLVTFFGSIAFHCCLPSFPCLIAFRRCFPCCFPLLPFLVSLVTSLLHQVLGSVLDSS